MGNKPQPMQRPEVRRRVCRAPLAQLQCPRDGVLGLPGSESPAGLQRAEQSDLEYEFLLVALRAFRHELQQLEASGQMGNRFRIRRTLGCSLAGAAPVFDSLGGKT